MAYVITTKCTRVGSCVPVCPTDSIHFVDGNAEWPLYYINPDTCIDCGACEAECPEKAIFAGDDVPANMAACVQLNADYYTKGPGKGQV
jgi:NAD-dependent dihydropyrimidine dehydrogenase PreA subunit